MQSEDEDSNSIISLDNFQYPIDIIRKQTEEWEKSMLVLELFRGILPRLIHFVWWIFGGSESGLPVIGLL